MIVISIFVIILYLFVFPMCVGAGYTCYMDKKYNTIGNMLTIGFLFEIAVFQLLYLVEYFSKRNFSSICTLATIAIAGYSIMSLFRGIQALKNIAFPKIGVGFFVFVVFNIFMVVMRNLYGVNDGDDAYVLGNALTVLTNDKLFATDYYTGLAISSKSYLRHLLASNPLFIAYLAKMTMIHPTILAHRVLGSFYIVLHNVIILNIANLLFEKDEEKEHRYLFASLVAFITMWDFHSYLTDSTFILTRAWQGKSMFCSLIIPFTIEIFLIIGKQYSSNEFPTPAEKTGIRKYLRNNDMMYKDVFFTILALLSVTSVAMTPGAIVMFSLFVVLMAFWITVSIKKPVVLGKTILCALIPMIPYVIIYLKFCRV